MFSRFFKRPQFLTRNILLLSLVSFFTDIASEMLYPVTPLYLKEIGYSMLAIGLIEGVAECTAGLSKLFAGSLSDQTKKRNIFIQLGYSISAIVKPAIGFVQGFWSIFFLRFSDRIGKGIRTAPRDAILTDESTPETRGRVFGFHRSIDTFGAMIGPMLSFVILFYFSSYSMLFYLAFIPGIIAIACSLYLSKEKIQTENPTQSVSNSKPRLSLTLVKEFLKKSSISYKKLLGGFFFFALINSSNVFLLLRAKELGMSDLHILAAYIMYNLIYALSSYPFGVWVDTHGYKKLYLASIFVFALVYGLFGTPIAASWIIIALFAVYGIFSAVEDGVVKAWLSLHIEKEHRATGLGLYMFLTSFAFLIASTTTGFLWQTLGSAKTFSILSLSALFVLLYFFFITIEEKTQK